MKEKKKPREYQLNYIYINKLTDRLRGAINTYISKADRNISNYEVLMNQHKTEQISVTTLTSTEHSM